MYTPNKETPMTLQEADTLARTLVAQHLDSSWKFEWNNRKRALGLCCYTTKTVYLSRYWVKALANKPDQIKDTILHEIAHAIAVERHGKAGWNHGKLWKAVCVEIGADPTRCYEDATQEEMNAIPHRYEASCSCGKTFKANRLGKHMRRANLHCKTCKDTLLYHNVETGECVSKPFKHIEINTWTLNIKQVG